VAPSFAEYRPRDRGGETPENLVVRMATEADCATIVAIERERDAETNLERAFARCQVHVADDGVCLLVAEAGGETCGFARAAWFEPPEDAPADGAPAGWYLFGVIVRDRWRRRGIGALLTETRLAWIAERADEAYYFANALNRASLDLHERLGFRELTRSFTFPGASFQGGTGVLSRIDLGYRRAADDVGSRP
jgi:ribosomal protein S18 acetylase RimI-like enzyme